MGVGSGGDLENCGHLWKNPGYVAGTMHGSSLFVVSFCLIELIYFDFITYCMLQAVFKDKNVAPPKNDRCR